MDPARLQDRIHWGQNIAARATGIDTDAYRPSGNNDPLAPANRFLRMRATFALEDGQFNRANAYGAALWQGIFDAAYTRVGDYLVQGKAVWFIAAQQHLLPTLCVRTNRVVDFLRPAPPSQSGVNNYGGVITATNVPLLTSWPASVLGASGRGRPDTDLPTDSSIPYWTILMPDVGKVTLRPSDLITDDLGRNAVVAAAELTDLGWRITARQATT
jgi:hypothetical protein